MGRALILRVLARMNVGGPARHVLRIRQPLAERGYDTLLVTGRPEPGSGEGDLVDHARATGHDVVVLDSLGRSLRPGADLATLRALRRLIATRRPDLIHTHTAKAGTLGRLAALLARSRPPLVHTFHGHVLSGYFGATVSAGFTAVERGLARRTDRLVAVSAAIRDELVERHGVGHPEQYTVIPPGIDVQRVAPDRTAGRALRAALGVDPGDVLVGCVGRLARVKDVGRLLDAFDRARRVAPRLGLLVVGGGPAEAALGPRLAGTPGVVSLPTREDLSAVYGALDGLALSSRREGLPQVVVEARQAGLPVVATAVGGVPELVEDGVDGRLVAVDTPVGSEDGLVGALIELAEDRRRAAWAAAAAQRDTGEHTAEAVAGALADLYDPLVAGYGAAMSGDLLEPEAASGHPARRCTSSS